MWGIGGVGGCTGVAARQDHCAFEFFAADFALEHALGLVQCAVQCVNETIHCLFLVSNEIGIVKEHGKRTREIQ